MSKEDLTWVVIRATGFLLTVRAVLYLPEMLSAGAWLWYLGDPSGSGSEGFKMSVGLQRQELISSAVYVVVYAALGVYLLRKGAWIHRLLLFVRPERSNSTPHTDARSSAALDEPPSARAGGRGR